jgi:hypothetical protein
MNPRCIGAIALVTLAAPATVALAAETESFHGRTEGRFFSQGEYRQARISFKRTGNTLQHIRFEIRVRCPSGQRRSQVGHIKTATIKDGRFKVDQAVIGQPADGRGAGAFKRGESIKGRIRGDHASGVVGLLTTLDAHGNPSNSGRICESGKVEWTADAP